MYLYCIDVCGNKKYDQVNKLNELMMFMMESCFCYCMLYCVCFVRLVGFYLCFICFVDDIVEKFGLIFEQFGENLRDNYQRYDVEQYFIESLELVKEKICRQVNKINGGWGGYNWSRRSFIIRFSSKEYLQLYFVVIFDDIMIVRYGYYF